MKKIMRLTESDLTRIVKKVLSEQRDDIPKDVKMVYNKYLMSPEIEDYIFEDSWYDAQLMWENNEFQDGKEIIEMLAHGFTFMAATMHVFGDNSEEEMEHSEELYDSEEEMSEDLLKYYDNEQIVRKVLENINHPEKEEVFAFIDKVKGVTKDSIKLAKRRRGVKLSGNELYQHILDNYISPVMDETDMDDFIEDFAYYDNVIGWGIEKYLESEEPEREEDWDYRDELENEIKDWWQPI